MSISFPVILCICGSIANFAVAAKLRHFKVSDKAPVSQAKLSIAERQRKIKIGGRLLLVGGGVMLAGAFLLAWLG